MKRSVRFLLSIISGVLLSLAWLGFPGWLLFIAFLPLLILDDFFISEKKNYNGVSFFGHGLIAFLTWNILSTWWVMHASFVGAVTAICLNSFFMGLVWWLGHSARRRLSCNLGYIALVAFYLSFEFAHYHWDIEWPWLTLGNGFANNVKIIQWYEFTGAFGGSLWVLVVNILLFKILKHLVKKGCFKQLVTGCVSLGIIVLVPVGISFAMYYCYSETENPREIVIVQPNIDPYNESHELAFSNKVLHKFVNLAETEITSNTSFVIGPETIFEQYWDEDRITYSSQFRNLSAMVYENPGLEMIFGAVTLKKYNKGGEIPSTARKRVINGERVSFDVYNAAIFVKQSGIPEIYHKSVLVSGVEKMPYIKYLKFLSKMVINLGGASGSLGRQEESSVFTAKDSTKVGTPICYESIFGEYTSSFVKKGAGLIFIITNDGWWKDTPGHKQHMAFARLRAIETRRSIARSANTGISCFINQRGDILKKTKWWEDAVIKGVLNTNDRITFYTKYGDYIARISAVISVGLLLLLIVKRFIRGG